MVRPPGLPARRRKLLDVNQPRAAGLYRARPGTTRGDAMPGDSGRVPADPLRRGINFGLSRNSRGGPQGVVRSGVTEELVAMQGEREPLKEPADVEDPVAAPLEHLHAVGESLNKPAR